MITNKENVLYNNLFQQVKKKVSFSASVAVLHA